jgi:hypothetical protein
VGQLCTGIEELRIDGCGFNFRGHPTLLARLPSRSSFRRLTLENLLLTDAHFDHLAPATARGLESLKISFCSGLVDFLPIINAKLSIAGHQSTIAMTAKSKSDGDGIATNAKSEASLGMELESKRMDEDKEESDEADLMENEEVKEKESEAKNEGDGTKNEERSRLKELVLVHCPELASLEHLPRGLERLSLQSCYRMGDREVVEIARLPRLKFLLLSVNRLITDAGLAALPLESLTEFHLHYWGMGVSQRGPPAPAGLTATLMKLMCVCYACRAVSRNWRGTEEVQAHLRGHGVCDDVGRALTCCWPHAAAWPSTSHCATLIGYCLSIEKKALARKRKRIPF